MSRLFIVDCAPFPSVPKSDTWAGLPSRAEGKKCVVLDHPRGAVEKEPTSSEGRGLVQLYKDAGANVSTFHGVPVFQAEGLTVKTEKHRYTPLFFSKDDLDAALGNARSMEGIQQEQALRAKAARAAEDLEAAKEAVCPGSQAGS